MVAMEVPVPSQHPGLHHLPESREPKQLPEDSGLLVMVAMLFVAGCVSASDSAMPETVEVPMRPHSRS